MITNLLLRIRGLLRRRQLDEDLEAELAHHLEMKQRSLENHGDEAHFEARRALGGEIRWKEETRALWSFPSLESMWSDTMYAIRLLAKDRMFTSVALLTLALGIGSNTAIFSILNGLLWRPLPVERPDQLVRLTLTNLPPSYRRWVNGREVKVNEQRQISFAMYQALQKSGIFNGVFGIAGGGYMYLERNGVPRRVNVTTVTGSYFPVLGLRAQRGRLLTASDDVPGGPPGGWHVVISDGLWERMFSRSPDVIGAAISIERTPFTIVGVTPPPFQGTNPGVDLDAWVPIHAMEAMFRNWNWNADRAKYFIQGLARLQPGSTLEQTSQRLSAQGPAILREAMEPGLPAEDQKHFLAMQMVPHSAEAGQSWLAVNYGHALWITLTVVAAVLLIASTNLTNLLLARSTARGREIAIRLALGAPHWRIRRQLLIESTLLAIGGAAAGLLWARWLVAVLQIGASTEGAEIRINTTLDWRMFTFLAAVLVIVVIIAGLAPALSAARIAPQQVLKAHSGGSRAYGLRGSLIVLQTALSLTLLTGAGLMLSSLRGLFSESTGFDSANCVFLRPDLFNAGVSREQMPQAYQRLLDQTRALPNIVAAAWTGLTPLTGGLSMFTVEIPGRTDLDVNQRSVFWHQVSDGYFAAVGLPLLAGSSLPENGRRDVGVVSEGAARRFFGGVREALGQRLKPGDRDWIEIIGVVADSKYQSIREAPPATLYLRHNNRLGMSLAIRFRGSGDAAVAAVQSLFQKEAGRLPYTQIRTLEGNIAESLRAERLLGWLLGGFAVFALLISATGLWGLLSYAVEQRRKELGIRIALGAEPRRIANQIRRQGLVLIAVGVILGLALSYVCRRSLDAYLFGVTAQDPIFWAAGIATLLATGLAATAIPAWRAARVDPLQMLRHE
jgi:predicted permease